MELETEDPDEADVDDVDADGAWAEIEAAAAAGDWESIGLDAPAAPRGEFAPQTVDDFLRAPE